MAKKATKKAPKKAPKKVPKKALIKAPDKAPDKAKKAPKKAKASTDSTPAAEPKPLPAGVLDDADLRLWGAWRMATERVLGAVRDDISVETGLSDPDVAVLTSVAEAGGGAMRQSELATALDWHRSRLSHQLTRMEARGLVTRTPAGAGVEVGLTPAGHAAAAGARPVHDRAVHAHLVARLSARDRRRLMTILDTLGGPGTEPIAT